MPFLCLPPLLLRLLALLLRLIGVGHPGNVEAGRSGRQRLRDGTRSFDPRPRRRASRHDAVTCDFQGDGRRRLERYVEPFQHHLRIERLIGDPARDNPGGIHPRLAQHRLRVGGERITQARYHEHAVALTSFGDHNSGLRPQPVQVALPKPLVVPPPRGPGCRQGQQKQHQAPNDQTCQADAGRRMLAKRHQFAQPWRRHRRGRRCPR